MIEIKSRTHTIRLFADKLRASDVFKLVLYCGYRGDIKKIPWYYTVTKGASCYTDLTQSMDEIKSLMKSNTRNEIRRAEREGCLFSIIDQIMSLFRITMGFAVTKGLTTLRVILACGNIKRF